MTSIFEYSTRGVREKADIDLANLSADGRKVLDIRPAVDPGTGKLPPGVVPAPPADVIAAALGADPETGDPSLMYSQKGQFVPVPVTGADRSLGNLKPEGEARFAAKADKKALDAYRTAEDEDLLLAGKADAEAFSTHAGDTELHVTEEKQAGWSAKLDASALTPYEKTADVDRKLASYARTEDVETGLAGKIGIKLVPVQLEGTSVTVGPGMCCKWSAAGECTLNVDGWSTDGEEWSTLYVNVAADSVTITGGPGLVITGEFAPGQMNYCQLKGFEGAVRLYVLEAY